MRHAVFAWQMTSQRVLYLFILIPMTAIDDILKAEQEAANAIAEATQEAEKKLTAAKAVREEALIEQRRTLQAIESESLAAFSKELEEKATKTAAALANDVDAIQTNFSNKKAELSQFVKSNL